MMCGEKERYKITANEEISRRSFDGSSSMVFVGRVQMNLQTMGISRLSLVPDRF